MDPADTQQAQSAQGATISRHEQSMQTAHQNVSAFSRSVDALVQQMSLFPSLGAATHAAAAPAPLGSSYACDLEPFDGHLNRCWGFYCNAG